MDSYSHFNTDPHMYSGIEVNVGSKKEIRIEIQMVTDFYSTIHTVLLRFLGAGHLKNRLDRPSTTDLKGSECGDFMDGGHTLRRRGDFTTSCFHFTATSRNSNGRRGWRLESKLHLCRERKTGRRDATFCGSHRPKIAGLGESLTPLPATSIHLDRERN